VVRIECRKEVIDMTRIVAVTLLALLAAGTAPALAAPTPADRPVLLADAQAFESQGVPSPISQWEVSENRRELASAVSAEKFLDGASAAAAAWVFLCLVF